MQRTWQKQVFELQKKDCQCFTFMTFGQLFLDDSSHPGVLALSERGFFAHFKLPQGFTRCRPVLTLGVIFFCTDSLIFALEIAFNMHFHYFFCRQYKKVSRVTKKSFQGHLITTTTIPPRHLNLVISQSVNDKCV